MRSHFRSEHFWRNISFSILVSVLAAHLLVAHDKPYSFQELLAMPRYYYSMLLNAMAALLLIEFVHMVSRRLYRRFRAEGLGHRWLLLQVVLGIGLAMLLELVIATLLFAYHGQLIWETSFFRKLFVSISMFILMVNFFFTGFYQYKEPAVHTMVRYRILRQLASEDCLAAQVLGRPALLFVSDRKCWSIGFNGEKLQWPDSLDASQKLLDAGEYFRGQREWMVHRSAIVRVRQLPGKLLLLETALGFPLELKVSRRRAPEFKQWWAGEIAV